jgi:3-oxoacyl-[acyl-carrier-protein] synthase II
VSAPARTTISGWSAVSPFGLASADFAAGVRRTPPAGARARPVPGFEAREVLGRKGTRSMDRLTALAVAAAGQLVTDEDGQRRAGIGPASAVVLGTGTASAQSMTDFARDTLTQAKPYDVDPARFPNTVLNCAAAQSAIWHQLRGPNTTVSAGRASGLVALNYARRLHGSGRADVVLCGAVEELSPTREWLESGAGALGEGCAMVLVEPAGRPVERGRTELAEVLALEFGLYHEPAQIGPALAGCARRAFAAAGESPDGVWAVATSGGPDPVGAGEASALAELFGDRQPVRLRSTELVGDTNAASSAFALVAIVAMAAGTAQAYRRTALVTAADADGVVGCALLRLGSAPNGEASNGEEASHA